MSKTLLSHYSHEDGTPTQNTLALLRVAVNPNASDNMKKACALSFRELADLVHTRNQADKRKLDAPKQQQSNKRSGVVNNNHADPPICSSESESDSDESIDINAALDANASTNKEMKSFFKGGKFK
jgi:hypothetical protein